MPKFTLLLGRNPIRVYDLEDAVVRVGRDEACDIFIDNISVSRSHAEFRQEGGGWVVADLGSANGTFMGAQRIDAPRAVKAGDQIAIGKFVILFDKALDVATTRETRSVGAGTQRTTAISAHEVKELLAKGESERKAHLAWESGGQSGRHDLPAGSAALIGTDDLCDVRVPKGPKHHLLAVHGKSGCELRNLHWLAKLKVGGRTVKRARLSPADVAEMGGLTLKFVAAVGSPDSE